MGFPTAFITKNILCAANKQTRKLGCFAIRLMRYSLSVFVLAMAVRAVENQLLKFPLAHWMYFGRWFEGLAAFWVCASIQLSHFSAWLANKLEAFAAGGGWMHNIFADGAY